MKTQTGKVNKLAHAFQMPQRDPQATCGDLHPDSGHGRRSEPF